MDIMKENSNLPKLLARKILGLPTDRKVILNIANLVPVKGHIYLLQAFKKSLKTRKELFLVIIGGGPLYYKLRKYSKKYRY